MTCKAVNVLIFYRQVVDRLSNLLHLNIFTYNSLNCSYNFWLFVGKLAKIILKKGLPEGIDLLNVNIPETPINEEFEVCRLGKRMYVPIIEKRLDPRGKPYYWIGGEPYDSHKPGSDGHTLSVLNKTTITPLKIDLTGEIKEIRDFLEI